MMRRIPYMVLIGIAALLLGVATSCNRPDDLTDASCDNRFYFVSSAVCSEYDNDAAIRDFNGREYIARDFFNYIDRVDVSVDQEFSATFKLILPAANRADCGSLILAPVVEILCFENPD
jgi:hypothetical protein